MELPHEEEEQSPGRAGAPLDARRVVRTMWRGRRWIALVAVVGAVAGFSYAKFGFEHSFTTSASVRFAGLPGQNFIEAQRALPSIVSVASTEPFLLSVRDAEGLDEVNIDAMRTLLSTTSDEGSGLITFTTYSDSAQGAANLANRAAELFVSYHATRRREELLREQASVAERVETASAELREARQAYDAFRASMGITNLSAEQETIINQAAELRTQANLVAAEVRAIEARVAQLRAALEETPQYQRVSSSSRSPAQARLGELSQRLREARGRGLGESHPQVQSLSRQVQSLRRAGDSDDADGSSGGSSRGGRRSVNAAHARTEAALSEALTELEGTRNRAASLEQMAVAAEERANHSSDVEVAAANLLAAVNVKGELVESLTARAATIDDQLQDVPTGLRTVSTAAPPESAVRSKKKKLIAVGVPLLAVFLAMLVLLIREVGPLRLTAPAEVAWWGRGPVVAATEWPRREEAIFDLLADLEDLVSGATGEMLVLGLGDTEHGHAERLAFELSRDWDDKVVLSDTPPSGVTLSSVPPADSNDALVSLPPPPVLPSNISSLPPPIPSHARGGAAIRVVHPISDAPERTPNSVVPAPGTLQFTTWEGHTGLAALRRRARRADGVIVVVRSGVSGLKLNSIHTKLGREDGIAFVLLGCDETVTEHSDRAGDVETFMEPFRITTAT